MLKALKSQEKADGEVTFTSHSFKVCPILHVLQSSEGLLPVPAFILIIKVHESQEVLQGIFIEGTNSEQVRVAPTIRPGSNSTAQHSSRFSDLEG